MTTLLEVLVAGAVGLGSALVPVVNAEAYAALGGGRHGLATVAAVIVALAAGQTAGKLLMFEAARRGRERVAGRVGADPRRGTARWAARVGGWVRSPRTGPVVVLSAAAVGVPPLAVVAVVAGAADQRRTTFAALCMVGRVARFGAVAMPVWWAVG